MFIYASALATTKKYDQALAEYQKVLHDRSQERCGLSAHRTDLSGHGQVRSGARCLSEGAGDAADLDHLNNAVGDVYLAKGDLKSAGKYFQASLSQNAHDPIAANNLAWVYAQQGDNLDMALSLATQAKQIAPEMNAVNDTLAWIQYKKGNYQVVGVVRRGRGTARSPEPVFPLSPGHGPDRCRRQGPRPHRTAEGARP